MYSESKHKPLTLCVTQQLLQNWRRRRHEPCSRAWTSLEALPSMPGVSAVEIGRVTTRVYGGVCSSVTASFPSRACMRARLRTCWTPRAVTAWARADEQARDFQWQPHSDERERGKIFPQKLPGKRRRQRIDTRREAQGTPRRICARACRR
jgi:hypothetical protein